MVNYRQRESEMYLVLSIPPEIWAELRTKHKDWQFRTGERTPFRRWASSEFLRIWEQMGEPAPEDVQENMWNNVRREHGEERRAKAIVSKKKK